MLTNNEVYEQLRKEFDFQQIVHVVYHIYKFKEIDNTKWHDLDVEDTLWWKNKHQELINNIEVVL